MISINTVLTHVLCEEVQGFKSLPLHFKPIIRNRSIDTVLTQNKKEKDGDS